jgi:uncharacterized membrane protein
MEQVRFAGDADPAEEFTVPDHDDQRTVDLSLLADRPGEYKIAVEIVPLDGELKLTNNRLETLLTVRRGGLKVVLIDVLGRYETKFIEKLNATAKIELDVKYLMPGPLASRSEMNPTWFEPGAYDVYIIGDVPADAFRRGQRDLLPALVDRLEDGAGLVMIGGQHNFGAGGYASTQLADFLPVVMHPGERIDGDAVDPRQHYARRLPMLPTRAGVTQHYILNIDARNNERVWAELPPLMGANRLTPKETASVLAQSEDRIPLLIATDTGTARTIAFGVDSTWLWHMKGFEDVHQRFWQQMMLWLARKELEGDQKVWVQVDPRNYAPQSAVTVTFGARDENLEPVSDAEFSVTLIKPNGESTPLPVRRRGEDRFTVFEDTTLPGDYWVTVTARRDGVALDQPATTRFIVDQRDIERDNPAADPDLMEEIASLTGTTPIPPEQFPSFVTSLLEAGVTSELTHHRQINLWDGWPLLLLFVLMMSSEWYLRKRRGLV